jgi:hypothetical protein
MSDLLTAMDGRPEILALAERYGWTHETLSDGSVTITKPGELIRLTFTKADPDRLKTAEWDDRRTRGGIAVSQVAYKIRNAGRE